MASSSKELKPPRFPGRFRNYFDSRTAALHHLGRAPLVADLKVFLGVAAHHFSVTAWQKITRASYTTRRLPFSSTSILSPTPQSKEIEREKRFSEEQIIGFLREVEAGLAVKELYRRYGFSEASYY